MGAVNFNPPIASGIQSATRATLTSSDGVLATNVVAAKFDFTSPSSENGYCGYAGITVFGTASIAPAKPANLSAALLTPNNFVMNLGGLVPGRNYELQSSTNLAAASWISEVDFVATQSFMAFTNPVASSPKKFYRVVTY